MSFSGVTKNELARVKGKSLCCRRAELYALLRGRGQLIKGRAAEAVIFRTDQAVLARKVVMLIKDIFALKVQVQREKATSRRRHSWYVVIVPEQPGWDELRRFVFSDEGEKNGIPKELVRRVCCRRAYLRGMFLAGGSVNNPEKDHHFELMVHDEKTARDIGRLMRGFNLPARISRRKNGFVVYLKESDQIVDCLNIMGAYQAQLDYENVRVIREVRGQVNRLVNCETANLNKTVEASLRQVASIKLIADNMGLDNLPPSLREVAKLRLKYPDISLRELGDMLEPRLTKSGVNHRLRRLDEIARKLKSGGQD